MISLTSPVRTRAHGWPAGGKLAALALATVLLFRLDALPAQAFALTLVLSLYAAGGAVFLRSGLRRLRPLWPFVLVIALWHGATGDWTAGGVILLRMLSAVALANLVTMTTRLDEMMDALKLLLRPFARFGVRPRVIELAVAMVIRFTPVLAQKGAKLTEAWRARSPGRPRWRVVVPLMVTALDDADAVAEALRARGGLQD